MSGDRANLEKEIRVLSLLLGLVVMIILLMGLGIARKVIKTSGTRKLQEFMSAAPISMIAPLLTVEEAEKLKKKLREFDERLEDPSGSPFLVLSERDLNYLLARTEGLRDRLRIMKIDRKKIVALVSLAYFTGSEMNYLNGVTELELDFQAGYLRLAPVSFNSGGKEFPKKLLWIFKNVNLLGPLYFHRYTDTAEKRQIRNYLRRLRKIKLQEGQVVLS